MQKEGLQIVNAPMSNEMLAQFLRIQSTASELIVPLSVLKEHLEVDQALHTDIISPLFEAYCNSVNVPVITSDTGYVLAYIPEAGRQETNYFHAFQEQLIKSTSILGLIIFLEDKPDEFIEFPHLRVKIPIKAKGCLIFPACWWYKPELKSANITMITTLANR